MAALLLVAAALWTWPSTGRGTARLRALTTGPEPAAAVDPVAARRRRWGVAAAAGLGVGVLLGGSPGVPAAVAVAVLADRVLRRSAPDAGLDARAAVRRELPAACDLLGVCLSAGLPVGGALAAVGAAVPDPLGAHLGAVAGLYRLGAEPRRAWAGVPAELAGLGRVLVRAGESGAAVADGLRALAEDGRTRARTETEAAMRRAGVWVLAPLGLCFLPAFVCLGVAPLVLGIAGEVFR
ncbi:type II secretion protein F [Blastococcus sp. TF02A-30]|nr:type II secretion protein F [Blastococcus sp. TF02A-30]